MYRVTTKGGIVSRREREIGLRAINNKFEFLFGRELSTTFK